MRAWANLFYLFAAATALLFLPKGIGAATLHCAFGANSALVAKAHQYGAVALWKGDRWPVGSSAILRKVPISGPGGVAESDACIFPKQSRENHGNKPESGGLVLLWSTISNGMRAIFWDNEQGAIDLGDAVAGMDAKRLAAHEETEPLDGAVVTENGWRLVLWRRGSKTVVLDALRPDDVTRYVGTVLGPDWFRDGASGNGLGQQARHNAALRAAKWSGLIATPPSPNEIAENQMFAQKALAKPGGWDQITEILFGSNLPSVWAADVRKPFRSFSPELTTGPHRLLVFTTEAETTSPQSAGPTQRPEIGTFPGWDDRPRSENAAASAPAVAPLPAGLSLLAGALAIFAILRRPPARRLA